MADIRGLGLIATAFGLLCMVSVGCGSRNESETGTNKGSDETESSEPGQGSRFAGKTPVTKTLGDYSPGAGVSLSVDSILVVCTDGLGGRLVLADRNVGSGVTLIERNVPKCVSLVEGSTFWVSALGEDLNALELGVLPAEDGATPRQLFSGTQQEVGVPEAPCAVDVFEGEVYWHNTEDVGGLRLSKIHALSVATSDVRTVVERESGLTGGISGTWLVGGQTLVWSDSDGIHRLDLETLSETQLDGGSFWVDSLTLVKGVLCFVGYPVGKTDNEGVWCETDGTVELVLERKQLVISQSTSTSDGEELFLADNTRHRLTSVDPKSGREVEVWKYGSDVFVDSNLVVDGDEFFFGAGGTVQKLGFE